MEGKRRKKTKEEERRGKGKRDQIKFSIEDNCVKFLWIFFAGEGIYGRGIVYPPSDKLILSVALTSCVSEVTEPTLKG